MAERIPILRLGDLLLVTVQVEIHDRVALALQQDLSEAIVRHGASGVLIDLSAVEVVDSFIGRILAESAEIGKVLGAETVVVGLRPAVAITLVELGLELAHVRTARDVDRGMELLRSLVT